MRQEGARSPNDASRNARYLSTPSRRMRQTVLEGVSRLAASRRAASLRAVSLHAPPAHPPANRRAVSRLAAPPSAAERNTFRRPLAKFAPKLPPAAVHCPPPSVIQLPRTAMSRCAKPPHPYTATGSEIRAPFGDRYSFPDAICGARPGVFLTHPETTQAAFPVLGREILPRIPPGHFTISSA